MKEKMTPDEYADIGMMCREADDGNMLVGSFAAELVGESYPFSKEMAKIVFDTQGSDEALGRKFVAWVEKTEKSNG